MLKIIYFTVATIMCIDLSHAQNGGATKYAIPKGGIGSGGGSKAAEYFVKGLNRVVDRVAKMNQFEVSVDRLHATLKTLKIDVVPILKDPETGEAIENQEYLYAYGSPGYIQIKPLWESWLEGEDPQGYFHVALFHELCRAAGIQDDGYRVSISTLHLDQKFLPELKFKTYQIFKGSFVMTDMGEGTICHHFRRVIFKNFMNSGLTPNGSCYATNPDVDLQNSIDLSFSNLARIGLPGRLPHSWHVSLDFTLALNAQENGESVSREIVGEVLDLETCKEVVTFSNNLARWNPNIISNSYCKKLDDGQFQHMTKLKFKI
jgi:hypothetical protein